MDLNNQQLRYLTDRELCDAIKALDEPIVGELLENCYEDLKIKVAKNIYLVALEGEQEGNYIPYSASDDWSYLKDLLSDKDFTFRIYPLYRNEQFNDYPRYTLKTVDSIRIYDFDGDNQHRDTELENLFHQLNFSTEKPPIKTPLSSSFLDFNRSRPFMSTMTVVVPVSYRSVLHVGVTMVTGRPVLHVDVTYMVVFGII